MTRSVADKSSLGNAGNGMPPKLRRCSRGADLPKNESEMTGDILSFDQISKCVSAGNGSCITAANVSMSEHETMRSILDTRSLSSIAEMTFSTFSTVFGWPYQSSSHMMIGNSGQISSISFTDLLGMQRRLKCRRRGDANTTFRHLLHT